MIKNRKDLLRYKLQLEEEKAKALHEDNNSLAKTIFTKAIPLVSPFIVNYAIGKLPIRNKIVKTSLQKGAAIAIPFVLKVLLERKK